MKQAWLALLGATLSVGLSPVLGQFDHHHAAWTALLRKHVVLVDGDKASQVRYAGFATERAPRSRPISTACPELRHLDYDWGLNDARK